MYQFRFTHFSARFNQWLNTFWGVFWVFGVLGNLIWYWLLEYQTQTWHMSSSYYLHLFGDNLPYLWWFMYTPFLMISFIKKPTGDRRITKVFKHILVAVLTTILSIGIIVFLIFFNLPCSDDNLEARCLIQNL